MSIRLCLIAAFVFAPLANALAEELPSLQVEWKTLAPAEGNQFSDPFSMLSRDQLQVLSYVVRVQRLIAADKLSDGGPAAVEGAEMAKRLTNEGVDIPWLMAQRERVGEIRTQQVRATTRAVAKRLSGKRVSLTGYVVPLKVAEGRVTEFYLVSSIAACSHASAPPENQLVYVESSDGIRDWNRLMTVKVTGRIEARQTVRMIQNASGPKLFTAGFAMTPAVTEVYSRRQSFRNQRKPLPVDNRPIAARRHASG